MLSGNGIFTVNHFIVTFQNRNTPCVYFLNFFLEGCFMKNEKETVLYDSDAEFMDEAKYWAEMRAAIMANDPATCPSGDLYFER
jgi:hypothetical protein